MARKSKSPKQQASHEDTAKGCGCLVLLAIVLFGGIASCVRDEPTTPVAAPSVAAPTSTSDPATSTAPQPAGEVVIVTDVIDGDTFKVGNRTIRVLGIEACEVDTYGGEQALTTAESALTNPYNQPIILTKEPGVETDRSGRELRYVSTDGIDFGESQIKYEHTGILEPNNGASLPILSTLTAADTAYSTEPGVGRRCSDPEPAATGSNDDDVYVNPDDDDDGGGESRFCRGRWYC